MESTNQLAPSEGQSTNGETVSAVVVRGAPAIDPAPQDEAVSPPANGRLNDPAAAEPGETGATASGTATEVVSGEPGPEGSEPAVDAAPSDDGPETPRRVAREQAARTRAQRFQQAAEAAAATVDEEAGDHRTTLMMPLVRHMAMMTKELNEAHRALGQLGAERDALRRQVAELKGLTNSTVPALADGSPHPLPNKEAVREANKEARLEAKAAKQTERLAIVPVEELDPELGQRAAEVGRRRRLIALGIVSTLVLIYVVLWMTDNEPPLAAMGKDGLQSIAVIGPLMSLMMAGFLLYRIVRVGGKARGWLFPEPEKPRKRRR